MFPGLLSLTLHATLSAPQPGGACIFAGATLRNHTGGLVGCQRFAGRQVALYFAGEWCPLCRRFTPALRQFHSRYADSVDIVFVSSDSSAEEAQQHFEHGQGDWVALDWADPLSAKLKRQHRVWSGREVMQFGMNRRSGVPAVVVVDSAGGEVAFMAAERDGASALKSYRSDWRRWPVELADEL